MNIIITGALRRVLAATALLGVLAMPLPGFAQEALSLSLSQAIARGLEQSPVLAASRSRADAALAGRSQAGTLPNPELSIEADNIYGDYDGMEKAEITYGVQQLIEMPGKRGGRVRVAEGVMDRAYNERDAATLDLIRDLTIAYAELVAAQEEKTVFEKERALAAEVRDSVIARVKAGKEPPVLKNKAEIELSSSEIALDRAVRAVNAKKQALRALMGGDSVDFTVSESGLPELKEPEGLEAYLARLSTTPDARGLEADIRQAEAALSLERANAMPDPTLGLGFKKMREDDTEAFVAGVSVPIPVFSLNRSAIRRAGHELSAVQKEQRSGILAMEAAVAQTHGDYVSAYREAGALKTTLLPGAEEAFTFARGGYEAGKFGYLEVLDAQRTLFAARRQLNEAVLECHRQRAMLERMTAVHARKEMFVEE